MHDSIVLDSTSVPPERHDLPGFASDPRVALAGAALDRPREPGRARPWHLLLALALAACSDRRIVFCDPGLPPNAVNSCPVAGAGGAGGGAGTAGRGGTAGSSGSPGVAGTPGVGGSGGSAGSAGAPAVGGTGGGGPSEVDASAPPPDAGIDAGEPLDAATP